MDLDKKRRRMLIGRIRQLDAWGPVRRKVKKDANGRCKECKKETEVYIDHIVPVFDPREPDPFSTTIDSCKCNICRWFRRLFVGPEGRQALCKDCHQIKSNKENAIRRRAKHERED